MATARYRSLAGGTIDSAPPSFSGAAAVSQVTRVLDAWGAGEEAALEELMPLIFEQVRVLARQSLNGENPCHTLQPTAVVSEVYLRLARRRRPLRFADRRQLFGFLAGLIRRILIDHARGRRSDKRGGGERPVSLDATFDVPVPWDPNLVALNDALTALTNVDCRQGQIVELRFFVGLTMEEIAAILDISLATVYREWRVARLWLRRALSRDPGE